MNINKITLTRPDDWHVHVRDGAVLANVVPDLAQRFARAIIMPNLAPPVTHTSQAKHYRQNILESLKPGQEFTPLMTLYLTDNTSAKDINEASQSGFIHAVKLYPAGATTNSDSGVTAIENVYGALEAMEKNGMPLLIHGEVTDRDADIFERESIFIERTLPPLCERFSGLKIVFEHITTATAADFVNQAGTNVAATITPHHLLVNRNAMLAGGIRPHLYCLPILKTEGDRRALINAATSGNPKFFLGTDSAPHARHRKESACGCAGIYSSHAAIELYAEVFDQENALDKLEAFASFHGADFYGLPRNKDSITLQKQDWLVPESLPFGDETVIPFRAGETIHWKLL